MLLFEVQHNPIFAQFWAGFGGHNWLCWAPKLQAHERVIIRCAQNSLPPRNPLDSITSAHQSTAHQSTTDRIPKSRIDMSYLRVLSLLMLRTGGVHLRTGRSGDTWC